MPDLALDNELLIAALAFLAGYVVKFFYDRAVERRQARLARVNAQLRDLYGPLYALDEASTAAWAAFRAKVKPGGAFFDPANPPTEDQLIEWRRWMREVFGPLNAEMQARILDHADLVDGAMPQSFLGMVAHVTGYQVVQARWDEGDFGEHVSVLDYPTTISTDIRNGYAALKAEQQRLLGKS